MTGSTRIWEVDSGRLYGTAASSDDFAQSIGIGLLISWAGKA